MLPANIAKPSATFQCIDCAACEVRRAGTQIRCAGCAKKQRIENVKAWRDRAKAGTATPVGSVIQCPDCSTDFVKTGGKQKRCVACAPVAKAATSGKEAWRRRKGRDVAGIGDVIKCATCAAQIVRKGASQTYCEKCQPEVRKIRARVNMARSRRKRGVPLVKGVAAICRICKTEFELNRCANAKVCIDCRPNLHRLDAQKKINLAIGNRVRASIKVGSKRNRSWQALLGYTLEELQSHLEAQFLPGMTFDNHGEWHIDHIRPLCSFQFETPDCPQFREAWALSNLQPLWAQDNLRKGGRWAA